MKVKYSEVFGKEDLRQHIVVEGMSRALSHEELAKWLNPYLKKGAEVDITPPIVSVEIDLQAFCKHWQSQVDRMIGEQAKNYVDTRFADVVDLAQELRERFVDELNKRLEAGEEPYESNLDNDGGN